MSQMTWPSLHVFRDRQAWGYLVRCSIGRFSKKLRQCPCCGERKYQLVSRKSLIIDLVRCEHCQLLYRVPQDPVGSRDLFYQHDYASGGLATRCPSPGELKTLLANEFRGTDKDFTQKIKLLTELVPPEGARVLDFGASWGYATWQMKKAGYDAMGYELSQPRAAFGSAHLGVEVSADIAAIHGDFDLIFSSHVLEHLPNPGVAFDLAKRLLKPGGLFIAFTPNGSECRLRQNKKSYDHSWGRLHPVYLDEQFYHAALPDIPTFMASRAYGAWGNMTALRQWDRSTRCIEDLSHPEMLLVWCQQGTGATID